LLSSSSALDVERFPARPRRVFVLGRKGSFGDLDAEARAAAAEAIPLVVLCIGYPVTPPQQLAVAEALRLSVELGVWFDAISLARPEDVLEHVRPGDEVIVRARGRQRRRLESLLRPRRGAAER
jgi:hypothetical protein